jgi:methionyl-tRNA formyltransferase
VKTAGEELGIPVEQPERAADLADALVRHAPLDVAVVVAFGMLVPPTALAVAASGMVNVHFSILPRWRGAAPVQWALLAGDDRTGVTVMRMDEGLDTGPVIAVRSTAFGPGETAGEALDRLAVTGAELLSAVLPGYVAGRIPTAPQPSTGVTVAPRIGPDDARLRFGEAPEGFVRRVRAMSPRPGAFALLDGARMRVLAATVTDGDLEPGRLAVGRDGTLTCGCGGGSVVLDVVQPEGRRAMSGADWARGRHGDPGRLT